MKLLHAATVLFSAFLIACPTPQDDGGDGAANPVGPPNPGDPTGPGAPDAPGAPGGPGVEGGAPEGMPEGGAPEGMPEGGAPEGGAEGTPNAEPSLQLQDGQVNKFPPEGEGQVEDPQSPVKGHVADFAGGKKGNPDGKEAGDLLVLAPVLKQENIKGGAHFVLSGRVDGDCAGKLRIDVLSTSGTSGEPGKVGPLTALEMSATGAFEIAIPEGDKVELSAICDVDGDDRIGSGDLVSAPNSAAGLSKAKSGIKLSLESLSAVPNPEEGGQEKK